MTTKDPPYRYNCRICIDEFEMLMEHHATGGPVCTWAHGDICGGCDKCISAQITHGQHLRHEFMYAAWLSGLTALHRNPIDLFTIETSLYGNTRKYLKVNFCNEHYNGVCTNTKEVDIEAG